MKKLVIFLCLTAWLTLPALAAAPAAPATDAAAMILIHPASGRVLAAKNADDPRLIASTTKLMTALLAVRALPMEQMVEVRDEWTRVEGSSMYLKAGESYSVRELLEGLLLASGNDAALALSETVAGDVDAFVQRMNEQARALGLSHTHFDNPHGLDGEDHRSSAADLAKTMAAALEEPTLIEIMGERRSTIHGAVFENHNKLLRSCPGVFAGKTGYTLAAGRCLVSACRRDGMELICVTLADRNDWRDHAALYDWAYENYRAFSLRAGDPADERPVLSQEPQATSLTVRNDVEVCVDKNAAVRVECTLPPFAFAPVRVGETAGIVTVYVEERVAAREELVWIEDVYPARTESLRNLADRILGIYRI